MPGGTEPLAEQLVMETTVCGCQGGIQCKAPGGTTRRTELHSAQGAGRLRKQMERFVLSQI